MNNEEKNVMTIVTIARIVEATLWYCLPPRNGDGFSPEERESRYKALVGLTGEGSPFAVNCDSNGDSGKQLKEDMQYFIEDVYGDPGRIVTVTLDKKVRVESSLIDELFSTIVNLRAYLEAFEGAALRALKEHNTLEPDFVDLINTDVRYYHAFAGKISCILISDKFIELNKNAQTYAQAYSKSHNGINPQQDPEFNVHNDPSFRMIENEFHTLNQNMVTVLNSYGTANAFFGKEDSEFRYARESVYADCDIFTGKKQTTDVDAYFRLFTSYFDKIIDVSQPKANHLFEQFGRKLQDEALKEKVAASPAQEAAPADKEEAKPSAAEAAPASEEEKKGE